MDIKKNNTMFILVQIIIIMLAIVGVTFAVSYVMEGIGVNVQTDELLVDYSGAVTLPSSNLFPISDADVDTNTKNVMKIEFSVKGVDTNPSNTIYDVALENLVFDEELRDENVKWKLIKNGIQITEGNLSYAFDIIENGRLVLTNIQQDLNSDTNDSYQFVLWISETCNDIEECTEEDEQSHLLNKSISGKIAINLYTGSKIELVRNKVS